MQPFDKSQLYLSKILTTDLSLENKHFKIIFGFEVDIMTYNSLLSAIPKSWKRIAREYYESEWQSKYGELIEKPKWSQKVYNTLIRSSRVITTLMNIWNRTIMIDDEQIRIAFIAISRNCDVVKYRSFQYRLLHNAIFLNNRLEHMGIAESDKCYFCKHAKETVAHLFYECNHTKKLMKTIQNYLKENEYMSIGSEDWSMIKVLMSAIDENLFSCCNLIVTIMKQNIYAAKCLKKNITSNMIIKEFEFIHEMEKQNAIRSQNVKKYNLKWPDKIKQINEIEKYCAEI